MPPKDSPRRALGSSRPPASILSRDWNSPTSSVVSRPMADPRGLRHDRIVPGDSRIRKGQGLPAKDLWKRFVAGPGRTSTG